jgi:hypothetical protein
MACRIAGSAGILLAPELWYVPTTVVGLCILLARMGWRAFRGRGGTATARGSHPLAVVGSP